MRSERCGRLTDHEPHEWVGRERVGWGHVVRECRGAPVIEGGHFVSCDECGEHVSYDKAAVTCGAHRLHERCVAFFSCKDCAFERRQVSC